MRPRALPAPIDATEVMLMARPRSPEASRQLCCTPVPERGGEARSTIRHRALSARGHRGEVRFFLQRIAGGLYVEREDIPRLGLQSVQSLQFAQADAFRQWCDDDPVRFEHPTLHIALKRQGDELWNMAGISDDTIDGLGGAPTGS